MAIMTQKDRMIPLKIIWNILTIKLIRNPVMSFCPYIGRKTFFTQTKKAKDFSLSFKKILSLLISFISPPEYHHKGNLIMPKNNSETAFAE